MKKKREQVALLLLSYICLITVNVLWLFLTVQWVGLPCVIMVFPDITHLLSNIDDEKVVPKNQCEKQKGQVKQAMN